MHALTMFRRRLTHRRLTSVVVVAALLFSQLVLAAYICPGQEDAQSMATQMAAGEPCDGMDDAQPVLCHQHAASASQTFEMAKVATPSLPAVIQVLVVPTGLDSASAIAVPVSATAEARPPPDLVYLATLRLRV